MASATAVTTGLYPICYGQLENFGGGRVTIRQRELCGFHLFTTWCALAFTWRFFVVCWISFANALKLRLCLFSQFFGIALKFMLKPPTTFIQRDFVAPILLLSDQPALLRAKPHAFFFPRVNGNFAPNLLFGQRFEHERVPKSCLELSDNRITLQDLPNHTFALQCRMIRGRAMRGRKGREFFPTKYKKR